MHWHANRILIFIFSAVTNETPNPSCIHSTRPSNHSTHFAQALSSLRVFGYHFVWSKLSTLSPFSNSSTIVAASPLAFFPLSLRHPFTAPDMIVSSPFAHWITFSSSSPVSSPSHLLIISAAACAKKKAASKTPSCWSFSASHTSSSTSRICPTHHNGLDMHNQCHTYPRYASRLPFSRRDLCPIETEWRRRQLGQVFLQ